jgi:hypothetical protein
VPNVRPRRIAIDFDGTIVKHDYPHIGDPVPHAGTVLRALENEGNTLMLWTMRSGPTLDDAVTYCRRVLGITMKHANIDPTQERWTFSPKLYADVYIDDAALGCPLVDDGSGRPFVDWIVVESKLRTLNLLP